MPTTLSFDYNADTFQADPWSTYRAMREVGPVHYSLANHCYIVVSHEEVKEGLSHRDVVADFPLRTSRRTFGRNLLDLDGAAHRAFRSYIAPLLGARSVRSYVRSAISPIVMEVIGGIMPNSPTPVVARLASQVPYLLMCRLMGLPQADTTWLYTQMRPIARTLDYPPDTSANVVKAKEVVEAYFRGILAHGSVAANTMTARILDAMRGQPETFDVNEILATLLLVLLAGTETSIAAITNVVHGMAVYPGAHERCRTREGALRITHEVLRLRPPVHSVLRFANKDLHLGGVLIERRQPILFSIASANRDGNFFRYPDTFDPDRVERRALSFATGPHACPGMNLAEAEFVEICGAIAGTFTQLTVSAGTDVDRGHSFRHPAELSLVFS